MQFLIAFVFFIASVNALSRTKFSATTTTSTLIPLSANSYSFTRGTPSPVVVDLYIDLACSDTQLVWSQLNDVVKTFKDRVQFHVHVFPLPYHQQAFLLSKAATIVKNYGGLDSAFIFMDTCFEYQSQIYNDATADLTYNQVISLISKWATNGTGVTTTQFYEGMNRSTAIGQQLEMNTRYMWKYSTLHEVFGTPLYYVNNEFVLDGLNTYEDWVATLTALLAQV